MVCLRDISLDVAHGGDTPDWLVDFPVTMRPVVSLVYGQSPYLAGLLDRHREWVLAHLDTNLDTLFAQIYNDFDESTYATLEVSLRVAKARVALVLAMLDIGEAIPVMETTRYLTQFADIAVECGLRFLLAAEAARGKLPNMVTTPECGIFALAMGKQGAFELNYSSDIDLIMLFDEDRFEDHDIYDIRKSLIKVVQRLVKLMAENTKDGYVFRTDLRLRPDPSVTPVVMTADQALSYYEALGRTWERAAFIKARVCAGDMTAGEAFLEDMKPFIWRKHLDFAAIEDAHNMRQRIRAHKKLDGPIELIGHHLKLGRGGIREIEFFAQTRQLIYGGRDIELRSRPTLETLVRLVKRDLLSSEDEHVLREHYLWLRGLEHITQMIHDQQTHIVPAAEDNLARFLALAKAGGDFAAEFVSRCARIDAMMDHFYQGHQEKTDDSVDLDEQSAKLVDRWSSLPATRSERAQNIFDRIRPKILAKLTASHQPAEAIKNFDRFLTGLPAGVQIFSLFEANPALQDLLAEICALAPSEAEFLGKNAGVFEAVLASEFFAPIEASDAERDALAAHLELVLLNANDYEGVLDTVRKFNHEAQFRVSVHLLRGLIRPEMAGRAYTQIADVSLKAIFDAVNAEMLRRYGAPIGRGAVVLGMGSFGSRQMTRTSDLDLVVIYDGEGTDMSISDKPIAMSTYYARFTKNLIAALTVATSQGTLYEVDMRLRPSGRQGPVAVSLSAFREYQMNDAWTWEHMALLRARVVAGDEVMADDVANVMRDVLTSAKPKQKVLTDVVEMRDKLRDNFPAKGEFSIKRGQGRLMELQLILQGLSLLEEGFVPSMSDQAMLAAIHDETSQVELGKVLSFYTILNQLASLCFAGNVPENPPIDWINLQLPFTDAKNFSELMKYFASYSNHVIRLFERIDNEVID